MSYKPVQVMGKREKNTDICDNERDGECSLLDYPCPFLGSDQRICKAYDSDGKELFKDID